MTTMLALISAFLFLSSSKYSMLIFVIIVGVVQYYTKGIMNISYRENMSIGGISDIVTVVNMISSIIILGLFIYGAFYIFG